MQSLQQVAFVTDIAVWHDVAVFHIGEIVRKLREEQNLGVVEFAQKAGISPTTLGEIEKNTGNPRANTWDKIAAALGTTVGELHARLAAANQAPKEEPTALRGPLGQEFTSLWNRLSARSQTSLVAVAREIVESRRGEGDADSDDDAEQGPYRRRSR